MMLLTAPYNVSTYEPRPDPIMVVYAVENEATVRPIDRAEASFIWNSTASRVVGPTARASSLPTVAAVESVLPERSLAELRRAIAEALPVDPEAEANFESWLRAQEIPVKKRPLTRRARAATDG